ncbi:MAG: hypothetical protein IPM52_13345 [Bacteroidetes bacterium]|nr:hypothetical protein [Bacteroidota bacterium]
MKTTVKDQRTQQQQQLQRQIEELLGMSTEEMQQLIFETGCRYMEDMTNMAEVAQEFLLQPVYWNWWRQQWAIIDAQFLLQHANAPLQAATMRALYEKIHNSIDTWPDRLVWMQVHSAYEQMVRRVIENQHNDAL